MRKSFFFIIIIVFAIFICISGYAAELSSNLQINKEYKPNTKLVSRETFVDSQGNPVMASDKGYAIITYTYNGVNLMETNYLDAEGKLVNNTDGYATIKYEYKLRAVIRIAYFDAEGNAVSGPEGYSVQEIKRGTKGLETDRYEYDPDGNLLIHGTTEYVDIQKSNLIKSKSWYNAQNEPTAGPEGYAKVEYDYFKRRKCRTAYYNADESLFINKKDGFAEREEVYKNGSISELVFRGEDGNLINGPQGYARVTYTYAQGGKETLTMYYNADGSPFFTKNGYCGIKQIKENRRVVDESYYSAEGVRGMCKDGYSRTTKLYTLRGQVLRQCFYDEQDHLMIPENIGYAKVQNTYSTRYLLKTEYFDENEQPSYCPDGYSVAIHSYADKARKDTVYYDTDGKTVMNGKEGYAKIVYEYNDKRQVTGEAYYDAAGNRKTINGDADEVRYIREGQNIASESYWRDGQPVNGEKGYHEVQRVYTTGNKIQKEFYYDVNGNLINSTEGYAGFEKQYTSAQKEMATLYYNETGELILTPGKEYAYMLIIPENDKKALTTEVPKEDTEEDEEESEEEVAEQEEDTEASLEEEAVSANTVYIEYYGTDRKLMNTSSGYAYLIRQTDVQGRMIREEYYDNEGNKAVLKNGYDEIRQTYTDSKKPSRIEYYRNGMPALYNDNYATVEREYDDAGNTVTEKYFNTDHQPAPCKNGYEMIRKEYNEEKRVSKEAYYDRNGQPMINTKGIYQTAFEYNEDGKVTKETYYDGAGQSMACPDGYVGLERIYNSQGGTIATMYCNEVGELIQTPGKEYAYVMTIPKAEKDGTAEEDQNNKAVYLEYYGTDGKLMKISSGYAVVLRYTDKQGRTTREIYYDQDGNRALQKNEYDEIRQMYGEGKKPIRIEYYLSDEPVMRSDGYAAIEREYDEAGNIIIEKYYNADLQPEPCKNGCEMIRREYNDNKKVIKEEYFDHNGQTMTNKNGVYQTAYEYKENGKVTKEAYFDSEGNSMACLDGYAGLERMYNNQGGTMATLYYDESDELMLTPGKEYAYQMTIPKEEKDGVAEEDENIRAVYLEYYGTDGKLMMLSSGYAAILRRMDEKGRTVGEIYYDQDGQRTVRNNTFDEVHNIYTDDNKSPSRIEYYKDNEPVLRTEGYAAIEREYDEAGNVILEKYYDDEFKPIKRNGYEMIRREYNGDKRVIKESYFTNAGEPMVNNKGIYETTFEYNEQGKVVREAYFDTDGQPMVNSNGYIMIERAYNEEGKKVSETSYTLESLE